MDSSIATIPLERLALAFIPVTIVIGIMLRWSLNATTGLFAVGRMLLQLLLIGFFLNWIFATESGYIVVALLSVMLIVASWIAIRPLSNKGWPIFLHSWTAIMISGSLTLALVTGAVLQTEPWYAPNQVIPLAGMIFASAMNTVSLAAERFESALLRGTPVQEAQPEALRAALIPLLNSLFAVGLVSLPGMMTGQILSGVSPLIAVRYQIMVMCMLTGASGIAAAIYLTLARRRTSQNPAE